MGKLLANTASSPSEISEDTLHNELNWLKGRIYRITHSRRGEEIDEKTLTTCSQTVLKGYRDTVELLLEELERRALEESIQEFEDAGIS